MIRTVESRRVIRIEKAQKGGSKAPEIHYLRKRQGDSDYVGETLHGGDGYRCVKDIRDALDLREMPDSQAMHLFYCIKETTGLYSTVYANVDIVDLDLIMEVTPTRFDEDAEREFLQGRALKKLTMEEIQALGVEAIAVYDKLKNHNA